jgi:hypothetical protein
MASVESMGVALVALCSACTVSPAELPAEDISQQNTQESPDDEPIGTAELASESGDICRVGCAGAAATGCFWVSRICRVTTVITIGRAVLPCALAEIAACIGGPMGAALCSKRCEP